MDRADFDLWTAPEVARLLALVEGERDHYRDVAAALPTPLAVVGEGQNIAWANRAFLRWLGVRAEDLRGKSIEQILPVPGLANCIRAGGSLPGRVRDLSVQITAFPMRALAGGEETLLTIERETAPVPDAAPAPNAQAERMDALQAVAGRLAHDLNNPLMIVAGYTEEVLASLAETDPVRAEVKEIQEAARRISAVVARLTEFARRSAHPAQPVDLGALVGALEERMKTVAGERVTVTLTRIAAPVLALADASQLEEAILMLASGSLESAKERTRLDIRLESGGGRACVVLRDDGRGVEAGKQGTVFESALTAKTDSPEAISGMNLARAYLLVRQWGGDIVFSSTPHGSEYRLYLALAEPGSQAAEKPASPVTPSGPPTILVVDDEDGIRQLVLRILRREGYRVLEAASAEQALETAGSQHVDLLLTDVMLPGLAGGELARRMYGANSRLKVLYISGYSPDEGARAATSPPGAAFLAKPFTLAGLVEKVRAALGR